jgi:broad specificity phosphatase PhoE
MEWPSPVIVSAVVLVIIIALLLMRPRRFYLVRHGETILNAQHIRQSSEGGLSDNGKQQVERVGEVLQGLHIKRIISSTYERAKETSEIINKYLKVPIIYTPLLVERRNPTEIIGQSTKDPQVSHIIDQMDLAVHEDDFRISDEENFADLKERAHKCLDLLAQQGALATVVVTHHHFLKMLLAYMLYREQIHANDMLKISFFNPSDNAGITICDYNPWKSLSATKGWEIVSYNEQP